MTASRTTAGDRILILEPKEHKSIIILVFGTALNEMTALSFSILIFYV